eukprot:30846-Eustigmatos_ZCMA.PRE.1
MDGRQRVSEDLNSKNYKGDAKGSNLRRTEQCGTAISRDGVWQIISRGVGGEDGLVARAPLQGPDQIGIPIGAEAH